MAHSKENTGAAELKDYLSRNPSSAALELEGRLRKIEAKIPRHKVTISEVDPFRRGNSSDKKRSQ